MKHDNQNNNNNQYSNFENVYRVQTQNDTKYQQLKAQQYPKINNRIQCSNTNVQIPNKPSSRNFYFKSINVPKKFNDQLIKKLIRDKRFLISNLKQDQKIPNFQLKRTRVPFTKEEDERIIQLVNRFGCGKWDLVSHFMERRTAKQCRDRYTNYLIPGVFHGEWTKEEDDLLFQMYKNIGPKWSIIQRYVPSRSATSIKNRWNYFLSKQNNLNRNGEIDGEIVNEIKNSDESINPVNIEGKNDELKDKDYSYKFGNEIVENKNNIFDFDNDWMFNEFYIDQKSIIDK